MCPVNYCLHDTYCICLRTREGLPVVSSRGSSTSAFWYGHLYFRTWHFLFCILYSVRDVKKSCSLAVVSLPSPPFPSPPLPPSVHTAATGTVHPRAMFPAHTLPFRFVRELSAEDVAEVEAEAERRSKMGELHADEFNPYGQAYVQAEEA